MPTSFRHRRTTLFALLATPALMLALAGCSSDTTAAPTDQGPSDNSSESAPGPLSGDDYTAAYHEYDLKLAECFRDQGLDIADPPADGYLEADGPEFQEAFPTCSAEVGPPPVREITADERVDALGKNLDRASCLREKGYDIVEPTLEDPGFIPAEVTTEDFNACHVD
ncbi:hypothetical protein [Marisediminicola sp. LYQ134]|uniref:hypothetical protein n=1 Tax=Marisediminicola sp. LYQ134 TaxID=3391061 RepID=UPI0039836B39